MLIWSKKKFLSNFQCLHECTVKPTFSTFTLNMCSEANFQCLLECTVKPTFSVNTAKHVQWSQLSVPTQQNMYSEANFQCSHSKTCTVKPTWRNSAWRKQSKFGKPNLLFHKISLFIRLSLQYFSVIKNWILSEKSQVKWKTRLDFHFILFWAKQIGKKLFCWKFWIPFFPKDGRMNKENWFTLALVDIVLGCRLWWKEMGEKGKIPKIVFNILFCLWICLHKHDRVDGITLCATPVVEMCGEWGYKETKAKIISIWLTSMDWIGFSGTEQRKKILLTFLDVGVLHWAVTEKVKLIYVSILCLYLMFIVLHEM